jgi:hypothetical protein
MKKITEENYEQTSFYHKICTQKYCQLDVICFILFVYLSIMISDVHTMQRNENVFIAMNDEK